MYTDVLGLVTTGIGNLIDSVPAASALPWRVRAIGALAGLSDVATEWHTVKDGKIAAWRGPRPLCLLPADIEALVNARLQQNELYLSRRWANWASWPADAQLGAHSCAWAAGPAWRAPHFDLAANAMDFTTCAQECLLDATGNPGLTPRNKANQLLFSNAAQVVCIGLPRDVLCWPNTV
jgi:hypothetical protein